MVCTNLFPKIAKVFVLLAALVVVQACGSWISEANAAAKTWNGTVDSNFEEAGNWSPNGVPANGDSIVFPGPPSIAPSYECVVDESWSDRTFVSITMNANAPHFFEITTNGYIKVSGNVTDNSSAVTPKFKMTGGTLEVGGALSGVGLNLNTGGLVIFNGANQSIPNERYYSVEINTGGANTTTMVTNATISKSFTITKGIFNNGTGTQTLTLAGTFTVAAGGTYTCNQGTLAFKGTADQSVPALTYYNVEINCAGFTATQAGACTVGNDLTLTSGTFALGSNLIYVKGDLFHNGGSMNCGAQQVRFMGSANAEISGSGAVPTFYWVYVAKDNASLKLTIKSSLTATIGLQVNTGIVEVQGVTLTLGSVGGTGLLIEPNGKIDVISSSAIFKITSGGIFTVQGTFDCTLASGYAKIQNNGSGTVDFTASSGSHLYLDGLDMYNLDVFGLEVSSGGTIHQLDNVRFYSGTAIGTSITITANTLDLTSRGVYFGGGTTYNVYLIGNGDGDGKTIARFDDRSDIVNGSVRGEAHDLDDDADDNGVGDTAGNQSVALWAANERYDGGSGTVHATLNIIDFFNFNKVGTVVFEKDIDGTVDGAVYAVDGDFNWISTFNVADADYGEFIGLPAYSTLNENDVGDIDDDGNIESNNNVVFFCTGGGAAGNVFMLVYNDLIDPSPLGLPGAGEWSSPLDSSIVDMKTVYSGPIVTSDFCFVNGVNDSDAPGLMAILLTKKEISWWASTQLQAQVDPAFFYVDDSTTHLYTGSNASPGVQARVFGFQTQTGSLDLKYDGTDTANFVGGVSFTQDWVYIADDSAKLHKFDHTGFVTADGWPIGTPNADVIEMLLYVDNFNNTVTFGDLGGYIHSYDSDGNTVFDAVQPGGATAFTADLLVGFGAPNKIYAANDDGKLFVINGSTGATVKTYTLPSGLTPTAITYDFTIGKYMIGFSDGTVWWFSEAP